MKNIIFAVIAMSVAICFASRAQAQSRVPALRWQSFTAVIVNPVGLIEVVTVSYRKPLYTSQNPLFATNYVEAAVVAAATPAYGFLGIQGDFQPLSVLRLRARAETIGFFGSFGHVARFDDVHADYSDTRLRQMSAAGENVDLALQDDERFYDSPQFDYLVEDGGYFVHNEVDVVWLFESGLVGGIRINSSWAVYSDDVAEDDPNGPAHRLGPLIVWPFFEGSG